MNNNFQEETKRSGRPVRLIAAGGKCYTGKESRIRQIHMNLEQQEGGNTSMNVRRGNVKGKDDRDSCSRHPTYKT